MKSNHESELQKMERALKEHLRCQGFLFSETPQQAKKLMEANPEENLPSYPGSPQAIFNRAMDIDTPYSPPKSIESLAPLKMSARKGLKLSAETLRKMNED